MSSGRTEKYVEVLLREAMDERAHALPRDTPNGKAAGTPMTVLRGSRHRKYLPVAVTAAIVVAVAIGAALAFGAGPLSRSASPVDGGPISSSNQGSIATEQTTTSRAPAEVNDSGGNNSKDTTTNRATPSPTSTPATTPSDIPTISPADLAAMASYGDIVVPVKATESATLSKVRVEKQDAVNAATGGRPTGGGRHVESVTLAFLTDATYGIPVRATTSVSDPGGPASSIDPIIKNRLVWLVIVSQPFTVELGGPCCDRTLGAHASSGGTSRMWTAVDAITGKFLIASTF
jgi:hypothetical protein